MSALDPQRVDVFRDALRSGATRAQAAAIAGINLRTVQRRERADADFKRRNVEASSAPDFKILAHLRRLLDQPEIDPSMLRWLLACRLGWSPHPKTDEAAGPAQYAAAVLEACGIEDVPDGLDETGAPTWTPADGYE